MKIRKINISLERFKYFFRNGTYHFKIENGLDKKDKLIYIKYNPLKLKVECYFESEGGSEIPEGVYLDFLESFPPDYIDLKNEEDN